MGTLVICLIAVAWILFCAVYFPIDLPLLLVTTKGNTDSENDKKKEKELSKQAETQREMLERLYSALQRITPMWDSECNDQEFSTVIRHITKDIGVLLEEGNEPFAKNFTEYYMETAAGMMNEYVELSKKRGLSAEEEQTRIMLMTGIKRVRHITRTLAKAARQKVANETQTNVQAFLAKSALDGYGDSPMKKTHKSAKLQGGKKL